MLFRSPVLVRGVLPADERKVSDLAGQFKSGSLKALQPGSGKVVLGGVLARSLNVRAGDRVTLLLSAPGAVLPQSRALTVAGIFEAGHYQYDAALAFVHLDDAEQLQGVAAPSGLRIRIADLHAAPRVAHELQRQMDGQRITRDWSQVNAVWFAAVQSQKRMMFIILTLIVAVAAFNLVSTLVMTVRDKQADIAILRTLGATPRSIMQIFVVQGTLVGVLGTLLGVGLGVALALNIDVIVPFIEHRFGVQFLSQDIYMISEIPSELHWDDVFTIGGTAVLLAFVATLYPSWSAARTDPAAALRYE